MPPTAGKRKVSFSPKLRRSQSELKLDSLSLDPEPGVGEATVVVKTLDYFRRGERVAVCMHACVCACKSAIVARVCVHAYVCVRCESCATCG